MFKSSDNFRIRFCTALRNRRRVRRSQLTAFAGECPADKMKPNVREKVDYKPVGVTDVTLGAINLGKAAGQHQGSRAALPQADDRARRHRAVAQP